MRHIYNILFYFVLPLILLRLLWKARKLPAYRQRLRERLAYFTTPPLTSSIWIHAVSLGEAVTTTPLIKELKARYNIPIFITTMTPTGSEYVTKTFGKEVLHSYIPYDYSGAVQRFLKHINPKLVIIMEAELWPNILHYCGKRGISVVLANARLSPHSLQGYQRVKKFMLRILSNINVIATQSKFDTQRFIELGIDPKRVTTIGNLKFNKTIPAHIVPQAKQLREKWGQDRLIFIAASTHQGEEEKVLQAYQIIKQTLPNSLLVLVPRHPERFAQVTNLCEQQGYQVISYQRKDGCSSTTDIIIGDTMGELLLLYTASDVAFVGGSLVPEPGGHNVLEPAALGVPAISGPYVHNFVEINKLLEDARALITAQNPTELAQQAIRLLQDESLRKEQAANGLKIVEQNKAALQKLLKLIENL